MERSNRKIGKGAMEYGKFRRNSKGEWAVAVVEDVELEVVTLNITESGNHAIVEPAADEAVRLKGFHISNNSGTDVDISFREEEDGELKYTTHLVDEGQTVDRKLPGAWALGNGRALNVYASGACDVFITIEYEGPSESEEEKESLADSMSISEELATTLVKVLSDSMTITESIGNVLSLELSDSMSISDGDPYITGDRTKALTDSLSIAESQGNQTTLSLSDTMSIAESESIIYTPA